MFTVLFLAMLAAPVPQPSDCLLAVRFGSYAMGIDRAAAARFERFLRGRREVAGLSRHPWGREGEYTLCARLRPGTRPEPLARRLRAMIPAKPHGPIHVVISPARL